MTELDIELKKAEGIIFSASENIKTKPSVVLLIFKTKEECEKVRDTINTENADYNLIVMKERDYVNISIVAKHINEVFNIDNLHYNESELNLFQKVQPEKGKFVFGTGYFLDDQLIFVIEETLNPKFILFNGYELN